METKKRKLGMRYLYLVCLLLCVLPAGAQSWGYFPQTFNPGVSPAPCLVSSQPFPSEQQLSKSLSSLYYQASPLAGSGLNGTDKNLMFEAPEGGGGIPLGTPVKEAMLLLAFLTIIYGIIIRIKNSSNLLERKSYETNK